MKLLRLLGASALFLAAPLGAALSVQSAFLPGADLALYCDSAALNATPFSKEMEKLKDTFTKQAAALGGGAAAAMASDAWLKELGLEEKDFVSFAGSVKGIEAAMQDGTPDVALALQLGKLIEPAKLIELLKKSLAESAPDMTIKESVVGVRQVYVISTADKEAGTPDFHLYISADLPKTLIVAGTPEGLKKALANDKGSIPETLKAPLAQHGKPQMWLSFNLPEILRAQLAAATANNPMGPGSNQLGTAQSLALSATCGTDMQVKLSVDFAKPEAANLAKTMLETMVIPMAKMQLADPKTGTPPSWANGLTVANAGNTAIFTIALAAKDMEAIMATAMQQSAGGPAGGNEEAPPAPARKTE